MFEPKTVKAFTFHNVSINTVRQGENFIKFYRLYIPQCFY